MTTRIRAVESSEVMRAFANAVAKAEASTMSDNSVAQVDVYRERFSIQDIIFAWITHKAPITRTVAGDALMMSTDGSVPGARIEVALNSGQRVPLKPGDVLVAPFKSITLYPPALVENELEAGYYTQPGVYLKGHCELIALPSSVRLIEAETFSGFRAPVVLAYNQPLGINAQAVGGDQICDITGWRRIRVTFRLADTGADVDLHIIPWHRDRTHNVRGAANVNTHWKAMPANAIDMTVESQARGDVTNYVCFDMDVDGSGELYFEVQTAAVLASAVCDVEGLE